MFSAYWVPWFYIPLYAEAAVGATVAFSFNLLSITNATSIVGRLIATFGQKWAAPLPLLLASAVVSGVLVWSWLSIHTVGGFVAFSVLWGLFSGPMAVLPASIVAVLSPSMNVVGARMGMVWSSASIGILIGSPIAGALSKPTKDGFSNGISYAAACLIASAVLVSVTWALHSARKRQEALETEEHKRVMER